MGGCLSCRTEQLSLILKTNMNKKYHLPAFIVLLLGLLLILSTVRKNTNLFVVERPFRGPAAGHVDSLIEAGYALYSEPRIDAKAGGRGSFEALLVAQNGD